MSEVVLVADRQLQVLHGIFRASPLTEGFDAGYASANELVLVPPTHEHQSTISN